MTTSSLPLLRRAALFFALVASVAVLRAQITWTGATSTDWHTASNWSTGVVPGPPQGYPASVLISNTTPAIISTAGVSGVPGGLRISGANGLASLTLTNGQTFHLSSPVNIADGGATQGLFTITGGSHFSTEQAVIGTTGRGNLTVDGGATASATRTFIGGASGGNGQLTVSGAGSHYTDNSVFHVGYASGATGAVTVESGGTLSTKAAGIGRLNGSVGTATVTGAGSTWTATNLIVGDAGNGTLSVLAGGNVTAQRVTIGSTGTGVVNVDGVGSTLTSSFEGNLIVGEFGTSAKLSITNGGHVGSNGSVIGYSPGSSGSVVVESGGSWSTGDLTVGRNGGGRLDIRNGGTVSTTQARVSSSAGGIGGVVIDGAGSAWNVTNLYIGSSSPGGVTVANGAALSADTIYLGFNRAFYAARLNIGAAENEAAGHAGTVNVAAINSAGSGAKVVFNHVDSAYAFAPQLAGTMSVLQMGPGTTSLTGANTYTGGTMVTGGTLLVNNLTGSGVGTGALIVGAGATLGGSGFIGGATTLLAGAHLAPGNSPGTLTFTNGLALNGGSFLDFQLGTQSDLIAVLSGLFSGPTTGLVTLNLFDSGGFGAGDYTLFSFGPGVTFSSFDLTDFTFGSTLAGYDYALEKIGEDLRLKVTSSAVLPPSVSAVPEPSTYGIFAALGLIGLVAVRRRRRG